MKARIITSNEHDVWRCFAIETLLFNELKENEIILYLWQSDKNVMLGNNQNPWRECNIRLLENENGKLARRITGGGTIYSDKGNLLFSFIVPKKYYDVNRQLQVIINACDKYGVKVDKSGRNDMVVDGKKVSGSAFYHKSNKSLHHGSLLIEEDLENLVRYLTPSIEKVTSKGIQSVRSRVTNLSRYNHEINIPNIKKKIINAFGEMYDFEEVSYEEDPDWFYSNGVNELYNEYASWNWRYGKATDADITLEKRFDWGEIQLHFLIKQSKVSNVVVHSDALDIAYIHKMHTFFIDKKLNSTDLALAIKNYGDTDERLQWSRDISNWLGSIDL